MARVLPSSPPRCASWPIAASEEQSSGVGQIDTAVGQLSQTTQQNASSSEELAATAEEMSSQAEQLLQAMSFFRLSSKQQTPAAVASNAIGNARQSRAAQRQRLAAVRRAPSAVAAGGNEAVDESQFTRY